MSDDEFEDGAMGGEEGNEEAGGEFHFEPQDEDAQEFERILKTTKDGILLAIDCRKNMFKPYRNGKTPFALALSICSTVMRRKVITGGKVQIGIVFWGAKETSNSHKFDHLYDFMGLDIPSAGKISQIDLYSEFSPQAAKVFHEKIGSLQDNVSSGSGSGGAVMESLFWYSTFAFQDNKYTKDDSQRIWIFTNDDDPCKHTPDLKQKAIVRAKDLEKDGRQVTLWTMTDKSDRNFDLNKFWQEILAKPSTTGKANEDDNDDDDDDQEQDNVVYISSEADIAEIIQTAKRKEFPKRTLVSIPLVLGPNVEIGIKAYATVLETKLPSAVSLEESNARPIKVTTRYLCESGAVLTPDQFLYVAKYGGLSYVPFSSDDKKRIQRFAPASISILGFKPLAELPEWQNVRAPYLIRPDEKAVKGSTKAFVALLGAVVTQKVFAVARFIRNKSSAPKLVALLPQLEYLREDDNTVATPMGFLVIVLPFADDIRVPTFPTALAEANPDQVDKAKRLVEKLSNAKPFDPRDYENPALQKFWMNLEALALDKRDDQLNWKESENDTLRLPNEEELVFDEDFVAAASEFQESYGGPGEIEAKKKPAAKKRAAKANDDDDDDAPKPASKRKKAVKPTIAEDGETGAVDWKALSDSDGGLEGLTVPDLKVYLRENGLPLGGTKGVLIERIKEHITST